MRFDKKPTRALRMRIAWILCALLLSISIPSSASGEDALGFDALPESLAKRNVSEMVPEWDDELDLETLGRLERAAEEGDFQETAAAAKRLGRTCRSCHNEFRALVAAHYRGPRFEGLQVTDGSGVDQDYGDHMKGLSRTLNRVKIASEDERWNVADQSLTALRTELDRLGETCSVCHEEEAPRERILGTEAQSSLDEIAAGVSAREPKRVGRYLGQAAVQVCARCHGVHRIVSDLTDHLSSRVR